MYNFIEQKAIGTKGSVIEYCDFLQTTEWCGMWFLLIRDQNSKIPKYNTLTKQQIAYIIKKKRLVLTSNNNNV